MMDLINEWLRALGLSAASSMLSALITLVVGIVVIRLLVALVKRTLAKSRLEKAAHSLIISLTSAVLYLLLCLTVASGLGIDVTSVVALASVLTLAVSLALQNMMSNVIGGFTILTTHPFRSGDYVEIAGQAGTAQEISMTYTKLLTPDNKLISIPNSAVVGAQIINYSATGTRRVDINVSASYDAPCQHVVETLIQAGTVEKAFVEPAPFAAVVSYGESVINYTLRVWVKTEDYWDVYFDVTQRVKRMLDEEGLAMSYPHVNVHMVSD